MNWIQLTHGMVKALVNTVINLQVPQKVGNILTSQLSGRTLLHGVS